MRHSVLTQATGPWLLDASWHAFLDSDPMCRDTWIATTRIFSFAEWNRGVGVHRRAGTWHVSRPFNPNAHSPRECSRVLGPICNHGKLAQDTHHAPRTHVIRQGHQDGPTLEHVNSPGWQAVMKRHLNLTNLDECADLLAAPAAAGGAKCAAPRRVANSSASSGLHIHHPCVGFVCVGEARRHERQASASNQHLHVEGYSSHHHLHVYCMSCMIDRLLCCVLRDLLQGSD